MADPPEDAADEAPKKRTARKAPRPERAQADGYPSFAREFPRDAALDRLVDAFAQGNYALVRADAPALAADADASDEVRAAASTLLEQLRPDPGAKVLFLLAAALLVFLSGWWIAHAHERPNHDGPRVIEKID
jgi:hypothetical protein